MADTEREQQRAELYRGIWNIANDLRGSVDGISSNMCFVPSFTATFQKT